LGRAGPLFCGPFRALLGTTSIDNRLCFISNIINRIVSIRAYFINYIVGKRIYSIF
jgi:hypothetical protein